MTFSAKCQFWPHVFSPFPHAKNVSKLSLRRHLVLHEVEAICGYQFPGRDLPLQKSSRGVGAILESLHLAQAYQPKRQRTEQRMITDRIGLHSLLLPLHIFRLTWVSYFPTTFFAKNDISSLRSKQFDCKSCNTLNWKFLSLDGGGAVGGVVTKISDSNK